MPDDLENGRSDLEYLIEQLAAQLAYYQLYGKVWGAEPPGFDKIDKPTPSSDTYNNWCQYNQYYDNGGFDFDSNNVQYQQSPFFAPNETNFDHFGDTNQYFVAAAPRFGASTPIIDWSNGGGGDVPMALSPSWSSYGSDGGAPGGGDFQYPYASVHSGSRFGPPGFMGGDEGDEGFDELLQAFRPPVPSPGYVCNICHVPGHFIQYCPQAPDKTKTPYQGNKQCIGLFVCEKCKRRWKSSKSFAEVGQECKKCHVIVNPKKQFPLRKENSPGCRSRLSSSSVQSATTANNNDNQTWLSAASYRSDFASSSKPPASLTSDVFSCSPSQFPTPSPSPFSVREFVF